MQMFVACLWSAIAGKDEDAEQCFQQALELVRAVTEPGHPEAAYALGAFAAFCK